MSILNNENLANLWQTIKEKIFDFDLWTFILWTGIQILLIWIIANIIVKTTWRIFDNLIHNSKLKLTSDQRRTKTLAILIHNVIKYTIYFFAILMILGKLNFNLGPLLAGAGVVGLAIGFGAQNLVKDIITGFFIIFEDQFGVGDFITVGNYTGTVEEIGLRVTKIRKWTGELHIIPNGNITEVTNFSTNSSIAVIDVGIAYEEDIERVLVVLREIIRGTENTIPDLLKEPEVLGVQELGPSEVIIRITAETLPMKHYAVARILKKMVKDGLDKANIEIPYPRLVTYSRQVNRKENEHG